MTKFEAHQKATGGDAIPPVLDQLRADFAADNATWSRLSLATKERATELAGFYYEKFGPIVEIVETVVETKSYGDLEVVHTSGRTDFEIVVVHGSPSAQLTDTLSRRYVPGVCYEDMSTSAHEPDEGETYEKVKIAYVPIDPSQCMPSIKDGVSVCQMITTNLDGEWPWDDAAYGLTFPAEARAMMEHGYDEFVLIDGASWRPDALFPSQPYATTKPLADHVFGGYTDAEANTILDVVDAALDSHERVRTRSTIGGEHARASVLPAKLSPAMSGRVDDNNGALSEDTTERIVDATMRLAVVEGDWLFANGEHEGDWIIGQDIDQQQKGLGPPFPYIHTVGRPDFDVIVFGIDHPVHVVAAVLSLENLEPGIIYIDKNKGPLSHFATKMTFAPMTTEHMEEFAPLSGRAGPGVMYQLLVDSVEGDWPWEAGHLRRRIYEEPDKVAYPIFAGDDWRPDDTRKQLPAVPIDRDVRFRPVGLDDEAANKILDVIEKALLK